MIGYMATRWIPGNGPSLPEEPGVFWRHNLTGAAGANPKRVGHAEAVEHADVDARPGRVGRLRLVVDEEV